MSKPTIIEEKPINMAELKEELEKIRKRDKELGIRSNKTEEYLKEFVKIDTKKMRELKKDLEELKISRLKEEYLVKIIDTMPKTVEELKTLLQGYVLTISQADMKKIVETINKYG